MPPSAIRFHTGTDRPLSPAGRLGDWPDHKFFRPDPRAMQDVEDPTLAEPQYTWNDVSQNAGGMRSYANLGPGCATEGSKPDGGRPASIERVRTWYAAQYGRRRADIVAGHLLNQELGGAGTKSANLTVLTPKGNSNCKLFDNRLKNAVGELQKCYLDLWKMNLDLSSVTMGVAVLATVNTRELYGPRDSAAFGWSVNIPTNSVFKWLRFETYLTGEITGRQLCSQAPRNRVEDVERHIDDYGKHLRAMKTFLATANIHRDIENVFEVPQPRPAKRRGPGSARPGATKRGRR